jgi:hypothetical protein
LLCGLLATPAAAHAVEATGSISGTVKEKAGAKNGIGGLCVTAISLNHESGAEAETLSNGKYEIKKLEAGEYRVWFHGCFEGEQLNYLSRFYHGQTEESKAEPVSVTSGKDTAIEEEELPTGAEIRGRVLDSKGNPLAGVCVFAFSTGHEFFFQGGFANTNSSGEYTVVGLATGSYVVSYFGCERVNVVSAYYDTKEASFRTASEANATPVSVTAEEEPVKPKSLNDVRLEAGAVIEGTITDSQGNAVTARICLTAENPSATNGEEQYVGFASTNTGRYKIEGLATGTYRLKISQCIEEESKPVEWAAQFYNGAHGASEATLLSVTAGLEPPVAAIANVRLVRASAKKPANSSTPVASGTAAAGGTLSCSPGSWSGTPAPTFAYQWLRDGIAVSGATASTYTVAVTDEGHALSCIVTASNEAGSASSTSNPVQIPLPPTNPPAEIGGPLVNKSTGAITFKYEFPEAGSAALSGVVLHGASIARVSAHASKRCRHGQVKRGKRCVSNGPVPYGSAQLNVASAGVYTLTLKASGKARSALRKGKSVSVTVTLTFTPAGTTDHITQTQTVRVKLAHGKRKHK